LDPVVVQVIMRMLEADLARRYPNYGSLISDLKKAVDTLGDDRKAAKTQKKLRVKSSSTTNIPDASSTKIVFKKTTTSSIPELSKYKTYTTSASAAKSSIPTAPRKKSLAGLWITLGIVALLGVGVAGAVAMRNNRMAREAEQNALAIQGYRKKSKDTHAQIKSCVDNIMETKKEADNIVTSAKKIVGDLLGKHVLIKPRAPEQTAETDNTKDDGTPRFQEPKIKLLAGDILGYANILENDVKDTNLLIGTSDNLLSTVMSATSVSIAAEKSKGLDNNLLSAQTIEKKTTENIKTMKDIFAKMLEIKEKEKKGQQNDAEEEKRRKEEEEQRKKELAEQAASEEEKNTVQSAAQTALTQIKENRFKEALETIQSQTKDLKTSAAIEQAKLAMERAARVYQLFQFTGKTISAKPFAKGWTEGVANPMDITGATPDYLVVSGTKVPWEKVSSKQMLRIMDYSLQEGDVKGSQLAEYYLSAAIYCNMVGGDEAMSVSKYRNNALKFLPRLSEDADRLLESN